MVGFPITTSLAEFEGRRWVQLLGIRTPCVEAVERLQPYNRPEGRCLLALHRLWINDKHRIPGILAAIPAGATFIRKANTPRPLSIKVYWARSGKAVKNDRVVARIVMASKTDPPPEGGVRLSPALDIRGPITERVLPFALFNMYKYVRNEVMPPLLRLLEPVE
jgi:hypothetical protein